ncbi:organic hydroperoxide resistance protein [Asticcacaulis sp. BYS171W]|uniref:Organic hydroperoxide resistance protein n=1 Tax=Asticcacaulis aquaticus TaxID=2984212 RepID=A0ABT5HUU5_9CAUL|nr:organic hydroperoxide resistance protein [Asticcacaulis aquaticus]MDC7683845.1 organic hydroperoxide resistance protein [Asticcacaulis aquaticus]
MTTLITPVYTAHATATGGREGTASSNDGRLSVKLSTPAELGGNNGDGTNPEQLFAAGYAACFIGAVKFVGAQKKVAIPADASINSSVGIGQTPAGFGLEVTLKVNLPGVADDVAKTIIEAAHGVCPYSNATRGNIKVTVIHNGDAGETIVAE